jgi:spore coat protein U-like protein
MKRTFGQHVLKFAAVCTLALGAAAFGVNSYAATATGNFDVTATVTASCTVSGTTLAFGSFDVLGAAVHNTSTLTATCTNGSAWTIGLGVGTNGGGSVTTRKMVHTDGVTKLNYGLYTDNAWSTNWDNVTPNWGTGTGTGVAQTLTVYGEIPSGQTSAKAGAYTDTVTATINF